SRIVCGLPAWATSITWLMPLMCAVPLKAATTLSTSCHAATAVADAEAAMITNAPSRKRLKTPGPVKVSGNAKVGLVLPPSFSHETHELHKRRAVTLERRNRHPLLGTVMPRSLRAELDARDAGVDPADDVRRAVAADRDVVGGRPDRLREQRHVR